MTLVYSSVQMSSTLLERLEQYVLSCLPQEGCGALLGHTERGNVHITEFIPIPNISPDPYHHFEFDGPTWVRCVIQEQALIGIFHSHPSTAPVPSREDLQQLQLFGTGMIAYLITGARDSSQSYTEAYLVNPIATLPLLLTLKPVPLRVT
ncbi:M67 family metallopeptidase [Paenibacillus sp. P96]|uniref:M67 family metallopeptidase n=1 Tax=Paenibacillus zeirhizosphaerae TaxID=2987519 RepID=A0ABT9FSM0_9BACL|nr:M67 family metallopeptidase [Paenibacillus sp. P96]MDP4097727.1 M67 family metallopeptidase [Paenibacillus sp. P96]